MLLGLSGVGKTCLKRGLMGLPFDPLTNSTIVADVHSVRPMSREWISPNRCDDKWGKVTEEDEILELAQLIVSAGADEKLSCYIHPGTTTSERLRELPSTVGSFSLDKLQNFLENDIVQQIFSEAQQLQKSHTFDNIKCHPFFHLWDCGGQPVFLEVLPLFLTSHTLFLILFNASVNLEQPWESFYNEDGKRYYEEKVNMSTLQMMERWIAMIYSHLLEKDEHGVDPGYPRVVPIGTRKDELIKSGGDPREVMKVIEDSLSSKAFHEVVKKPMIIDNTTSGQEDGEDEGYKVVREKVLDMAMSKLRRVNTPIAWILFRKLLQLLSKTSPNANIISLQEVRFIASIAKVKPDDVEVVLQFYHDLGVFLYYPSIEGLKEKVILDPKWFVECLGKVLSLDPHFTDEKYEDKNEWKLFRSKGIIAERLLYKTCQGIEPEEFIELLTHFQLAVEVSTDQYQFNKSMKQFFIPAILPYRPVQPALSSPIEVQVAPLHVTFDSGFAVPGFFTRLSVTMLQVSNDPQIPFRLDLYFGNDGENSEIYHDRMAYQLRTPQSVAPLLVTVGEEKNCIAIDVKSYSKVGQTFTGIQNTCLNLKSHVTTCSESVSQCLQSLHSNITESISSPMVKIVCQAKECQGQRIHYLKSPSHERSLSIDDCMVTCEKEEWKPRKITIEEAYWFDAQLNTHDSANVPSAQEAAFCLEDVIPNNQLDSVTGTKQSVNLSTIPMQTEQKSHDTNNGAATRTRQTMTRHASRVDNPATSDDHIAAVMNTEKSAQLTPSTMSMQTDAGTHSVTVLTEKSLTEHDNSVDTTDDCATAPPPTVREVFSLLRNKAHNWDDIGRELGVSYDHREEFRKDVSFIVLSAESKLEKVLYKWDESQCSPATWKNIKTVFDQLQYNDLAKEVEMK